MKISAIHKAVADNYIANGRNATKAYQTVKPDLSYASANATGCTIINRDDVQAYLQDKGEITTKNAIASKDFLIQEAHDIGQEAREAKAYVPAMKGIELKAKLNGIFDKESDSPLDYGKVLQAIVINGDVNINNNNEQNEVIDI